MCMMRRRGVIPEHQFTRPIVPVPQHSYQQHQVGEKNKKQSVTDLYYSRSKALRFPANIDIALNTAITAKEMICPA